MSRPPLNWHPISWPWPVDKAKDAPSRLAVRARALISGEGEYHRDIQDDIICQMVKVGGWCLTLWWRDSRRIEVVRDNRLALRFTSEGLETVDGPLCAKALKDIEKAMVLDDLASA